MLLFFVVFSIKEWVNVPETELLEPAFNMPRPLYCLHDVLMILCDHLMQAMEKSTYTEKSRKLPHTV